MARALETGLTAERVLEVTACLAAALTPADVAETCLEQIVDVLGAFGGALLLAEAGGLRVAHAVGYPSEVLAAWPTIPLDGPTPAADAVRRQTALWLPTDAEVVAAYPALGPSSARPGKLRARRAPARGRRRGAQRGDALVRDRPHVRAGRAGLRGRDRGPSGDGAGARAPL
ncbi:MAG TPA: hypothetical protein VGB53_12515 [Rubricoccaceae bacterium]